MGLHLRYAEIFGKELSVSSMWLSKKEEEIDAIAKKWASVISNKYAREDAEEAARIVLRSGIVTELPELREADLGGKKRYFGLTRAQFHAAICEGDTGFIKVNKRAYKTWEKDSDDAIRGGWHAQRNSILHELGHYIDFCNDPDFFRSVEHEWNLDNVDKKLVKKQLSEYSLTNRAEFEAELNSAILSGKVFSEDILSLSHMKQTKTSIAKQLLDYGSGKNVCLPSEEVSKGFKDAMKVVFNQKGGSFSIDIMADSKVQKLIEAHADVLNRNIQRVEMSETMRKRLTRSNYIFSGMKTFHELNEAFPSLLDSNGNRKTFEAFLNDVRKIDNTYNSNYLRAEYNFVQSSAEMAAKWERFSEDGDRYNLQYRTANDGKVRPEHAALNGVTLPPSDPFWEEYYPPNGWNCRCTVVQVRKSKYPATPHDEAMALGEEALQRDTKGIFHFNPGKEDKTVPDYNPYTIRRCRDCDVAKGKIKLARFVPENELCAACKYLRTCLEHKYSDGFRNYKKEATNSVTAIDGKECANLQTGQFYQTKKSFKRGIAHAYTVEEVEMFETFKDYASRMTFVRHSPLGEVKNMTDPKDIANIQKKIHRGVTGYNVYEVTIGDELWELKTEVFKNKSETLYVAIRKG